jgi:hypothetical protein
LRSFISILIAAFIAAGPLIVPSSVASTHSVRKKSASKQTSQKQAHGNQTAKKRTSKKQTTGRQASGHKKKGAKSTDKRRASSSGERSSRRMSQRAPTPERYKEIQQALMQRGYLTGVATGVWDARSVDAMKRFQKDQNLTQTGKPSGLALIALGLGPKREPNSQNGQIPQGVPPEADSRSQP